MKVFTSAEQFSAWLEQQADELIVQSMLPSKDRSFNKKHLEGQVHQLSSLARKVKRGIIILDFDYETVVDKPSSPEPGARQWWFVATPVWCCCVLASNEANAKALATEYIPQGMSKEIQVCRLASADEIRLHALNMELAK